MKSASEAEIRRERINGIDLQWLEMGRGPKVLLLHGFPQTPRCWRAVAERLKDRFRLVMPWMRGYPPSEAPRPVSAYSLQHLVADVAALAAHVSEGGGSMPLVGHDWGGVVAWAAAAHHPELFDRLVILNAPHPDNFVRNAMRNPRQFLMSWYILAFQVPGVVEMILARKGGLRKVYRDTSVNFGAFDEETLAHYEDSLGRYEAITGPLKYYRAAMRDLITGRAKPLPRVKADTLVLWGQQDRALGPWIPEGCETFVTGKYELKRLEGISHWVPEEAPDKVAESMSTWFTRA